MKNKNLSIITAILVINTTNIFASQTGISEKISAFTDSDLKPILAAILFAGLLIGIIFNLGKLFKDEGWKPFALGVGSYVLIASALAGIVAMFKGMIGSF